MNYIIICLIAVEENMMEDPPCILYLHFWNGFVGQVSEQDVCCVERCVKNGFVSNVMYGNNMEKYGFTEDCVEEMYIVQDVETARCCATIPRIEEELSTRPAFADDWNL